MLKLTLTSDGLQVEGDAVYVNPAYITHVKAFNGGCYVHIGDVVHGCGFYVKETAAQVVAKIEGPK